MLNKKREVRLAPNQIILNHLPCKVKVLWIGIRDLSSVHERYPEHKK